MYIYILLKDQKSCTFAFANFTNPITQHMYKCKTCDALVCLICKKKCHKGHDIEYKGLILDTYCNCQKNTCQSLLGVDKRESEGYKYVPHPIKIDDKKIQENLDVLIECLSMNQHEMWSRDKVEEGWIYNTDRNESALTDPLLVPWNALTENEKIPYTDVVLNIMKVINYYGYEIKCEKNGVAEATKLDWDENAEYILYYI